MLYENMVLLCAVLVITLMSCSSNSSTNNLRASDLTSFNSPSHSIQKVGLFGDKSMDMFHKFSKGEYWSDSIYYDQFQARHKDSFLLHATPDFIYFHYQNDLLIRSELGPYLNLRKSYSDCTLQKFHWFLEIEYYDYKSRQELVDSISAVIAQQDLITNMCDQSSQLDMNAIAHLKLLIKLAECHTFQREHKRAQLYHDIAKEQLALIDVSSDLQFYIDNLLSQIYYEQDRIAEANKMLILSKKEWSGHRRIYKKILARLVSQKDYFTPIQIAAFFDTLFPLVSHPLEQAKFLHEQAEYEFDQGNSDKSISIFNEAYEIFESEQEHLYLASICRMLAIIYFNQKQFVRSNQQIIKSQNHLRPTEEILSSQDINPYMMTTPVFIDNWGIYANNCIDLYQQTNNPEYLTEGLVAFDVLKEALSKSEGFLDHQAMLDMMGLYQSLFALGIYALRQKEQAYPEQKQSAKIYKYIESVKGNVLKTTALLRNCEELTDDPILCEIETKVIGKIQNLTNTKTFDIAKLEKLKNLYSSLELAQTSAKKQACALL